jgi:hypothetical protein
MASIHTELRPTGPLVADRGSNLLTTPRLQLIHSAAPKEGLRRNETALHITGFVLPGVGVSTVRLQVLETVGQSRPRASSTRALKSSYPTALVTASIRLKATESWLPKCRSNSGVLNTRNTQASMSSGSRRFGSRSA